MIRLTIQKQDGYDDQIGYLVSTMNLVRTATINIVRNLTVEEVDFLFDSKSNSIGTLLMHIGAMELRTFLLSFEKREFNTIEDKFWGPALPNRMLERFFWGNPVSFYLDALEKIRKM